MANNLQPLRTVRAPLSEEEVGAFIHYIMKPAAAEEIKGQRAEGVSSVPQESKRQAFNSAASDSKTHTLFTDPPIIAKQSLGELMAAALV